MSAVIAAVIKIVAIVFISPTLPCVYIYNGTSNCVPFTPK